MSTLLIPLLLAATLVTTMLGGPKLVERSRARAHAHTRVRSRLL